MHFWNELSKFSSCALQPNHQTDDFARKIKHGNILEHKISYKILKIFALKCSNTDIGLTVTFYGMIKFAFRAFTWEEFMELVEDVDAKVDKCS